jgi:hypothetical protein
VQDCLPHTCQHIGGIGIYAAIVVCAYIGVYIGIGVDAGVNAGRTRSAQKLNKLLEAKLKFKRTLIAVELGSI